jgi:hypothetical protein
MTKVLGETAVLLYLYLIGMVLRRRTLNLSLGNSTQDAYEKCENQIQFYDMNYRKIVEAFAKCKTTLFENNWGYVTSIDQLPPVYRDFIREADVSDSPSGIDDSKKVNNMKSSQRKVPYQLPDEFKAMYAELPFISPWVSITQKYDSGSLPNQTESSVIESVSSPDISGFEQETIVPKHQLDSELFISKFTELHESLNRALMENNRVEASGILVSGKSLKEQVVLTSSWNLSPDARLQKCLEVFDRDMTVYGRLLDVPVDNHYD